MVKYHMMRTLHLQNVILHTELNFKEKDIKFFSCLKMTLNDL